GDRFWHVAHRGRAEMVAIAQKQAAVRAAAQIVRFFEDRFEYWGEVAGRGIDDPEHLGGGGLLLQGLACLGDQPRILHSDDCLRREILQERYFLFGEWPYLIPKCGDIAEEISLFPQWHKQTGAQTPSGAELDPRVVGKAPGQFENVGVLDKALAEEQARRR